MPGRLPPALPAESRWVCLICPWVNESGNRCARCGRPRRPLVVWPRVDQRPMKVPTPLAVIVSRRKPWLRTHFLLKFRKTTARVLLDRRVGERRLRPLGPAPERRRADRRARPAADADLQALGWAIVRTP